MIIPADCFWGSMGIFVRRLGAFGYSSIQIVSIRVTLAALFFPEPLTLLSGLGILLILAAVIPLNRCKHNKT